MPKRIADAKQIERHHHLLRMLCQKNGIFKQQLIHALNVSERTIERDIGILSKSAEINSEKVGRQIRFFLHHCPFCNHALPIKKGDKRET